MADYTNIIFKDFDEIGRLIGDCRLKGDRLDKNVYVNFLAYQLFMTQKWKRRSAKWKINLNSICSGTPASVNGDEDGSRGTVFDLVDKVFRQRELQEKSIAILRNKFNFPLAWVDSCFNTCTRLGNVKNE